MQRSKAVTIGWCAVLGLGIGCVCIPLAVAKPPSNAGDICDIFSEKPRWYRAAKKAKKRWQLPIHIGMAIIFQESSFRHNARPERLKILGFIPWKRKSSALGYAQPIKATWRLYKKRAGKKRAKRTNFRDSIDFIGWYLHRIHKKLDIPKTDPYHLYIAYHEGIRGYRSKAWAAKDSLQTIAGKVQAKSETYARQLLQCRR